ncbi:MAG TPA: hypothetical protein VJ770_07005 [Stellaceae bacterium]|nr:hypothetical protein [Stellaceae bacterium]
MNLLDRRSALLVTHIDALREAVRKVRRRFPFHIDAWVVLPDHMRGVWQRRYWEHTIRDDHDYAAHIDYIHFNPVKHGLVDKPTDWLFSSFRLCVTRGLYPAGWLGSGAELAEAGEWS